MPEPHIPTQSQVEKEHVCRVQVWVVCWGESGVQLHGVGSGLVSWMTNERFMAAEAEEWSERGHALSGF